MSSITFIQTELAGAIARGVRQCVVIGSPEPLRETLASSADEALQVFAVTEERPPDSPATFVFTEFASESLASALERSEFDKLKASLFVWLGGAYRTFDAVMSTLAFIASLPKDSGVLLDYSVERTSLATLNALDALASRISEHNGGIKHLIHPQALAALLRGLGFRRVLDLDQGGPAPVGSHLVSAVV